MLSRRSWLVLSLGWVGLPALAAAADPVRVAVFDGAGVSQQVGKLLEVLGTFPDVRVERVTVEQVTAGKLAQFDVVLHPGGSGSGQGKALGDAGRAKEQEFIRQGGGYVGVCAGAYLASCDYDWSLHVLDAKVVDRAHWARGFGDVVVRVHPPGQTLLGARGEQSTIYYHQGPLLAPGEKADVPDYEPLATYVTEIARNGAPEGVMPGTTAIARGEYGAGRVICFSPHPERTAEWHAGLHRAILWAAGR
jgi:glutamine amidotransferase-like uncharacterized protein